jgi:predicted AlkP superfamily pyrophosphatase or phosphodiesterase
MKQSHELQQKDKLSMVIFIDALGWEVLKGRKFLEEEMPYRQKLRSVFGFSSACVPSILTGRTPREHLHWSYFFYSRETSPFRFLRPLAWLPRALTERGRVRHLISRLVGRMMGFTGYFQLYNLPFKHAGLFDHCEKNNIFKAGGMNRGDNIFDVLERNQVPYHVSDWHNSEESNLKACEEAILDEDIDFAFLYMASMDGLLHQVGKESDQVEGKLVWYEEKLRNLLSVARSRYKDVRVFICSDHGMATVENDIDLMSTIEALPLTYGKDYVAVYDSTMARFWFMNDAARSLVSRTLEGHGCGRILSDDDLQALGCDFEGDRFGELIFLLDPGSIIVPSHMGLNSITGMHGYHPDHEDSDAALLSNVSTPVSLESITDVFHLMRAEAGVPASA